MPDSPTQAQLEQMIAEIRDKIRTAREYASDGGIETQEIQEIEIPTAPTLESLRKADEFVRAMSADLSVPPPSPPTFRGRMGQAIIQVLRKLLWWQQFQLNKYALASLERNDQVLKQFEALTNWISQLELWQVKRKVSQLESAFKQRLSQLETAQIRLQSAQVDVMTVSDVNHMDQRIGRVDNELSQLSQQVESRNNVEKIKSLLETGGRVEAEITELRNKVAGLEGLEPRIQQAQKTIESLESGLAEAITTIDVLKFEATKLQQLVSSDASKDMRIAALESELSNLRNTATRVSGLGVFTYQTRTQTSLLDRRLSMLIEELRKQPPETPAAVNPLRAGVESHQFDAAYVAFEDAFRGTREEIKAKQAVYIPMLKEHGIGTRDMSILDIGCGRGEWLELLRDHELNGHGVDRNETMLEECRNWGLEVTEDEAILHLRSIPANSLGAVTGFHIIEHIPFDSIIELIDECLRVLKPGGMIIMETPNPGNLHVGAQNFYMDPTHLRPLPSAMIRFFVEARGFCDTRILELHPYPESLRLPNDPYGIGERLNGYLYGPQDYSVIGRKV